MSSSLPVGLYQCFGFLGRKGCKSEQRCVLFSERATRRHRVVHQRAEYVIFFGPSTYSNKNAIASRNHESLFEQSRAVA
jgi:hypothetical protein